MANKTDRQGGKKEKATEKYRKYDQTQKCIIRNREEQAIQSSASLKLNNASLAFLKNTNGRDVKLQPFDCGKCLLLVPDKCYLNVFRHHCGSL